MDRPRLYDFMRWSRLAVVSTVAPDGHPQSALVGIAVTPALEILFDTVDTSRKCANLRARPDIAIALGWDSEQTVQYEGRADEPAGADLDALKRAYFDVWPDGRARQAWPGITYFRVRPTWIRFSDFDTQPATIEELRF